MSTARTSADRELSTGTASAGPVSRPWLRGVRGPPSARAVASVVLLAAPVVVLVVAAWTHRGMGDDGFINLRVVRQILDGHGPVFNQGQRVEAFTSPLWIALLTVVDLLLPLRLEWIAVGMGIALLGVGMALATIGAVRLHSSIHNGWIFAPAGSAVVMALAPFWLQAPNGQEMGLSLAWLGACCFLLGSWARGRRRLGAGGAFVLGLGPLVRPDLTIFTIMFLVVVLVGGIEERWTSRVRTAAWALAFPVGYEIFRMGYYGVLVPNTALAKSAGGSRWDLGLTYLRDTIDPYWLWVPLVALALGVAVPAIVASARARPDLTYAWPGQHRRLLVFAAFIIAGLASVLYVVKIGGDYVHGRLLLPALFGLLAPFAAVPLRRAYVGVLVVVPWAIVCTLWLRSPADRHVPISGPEHAVTLQDFGWRPGDKNLRWFTGPGLYVGSRRIMAIPKRGSRPTVVSFGIGIGSYALGPDVDVLDVLGLAEPIAAHETLRRRGYPGHEKILPAPWIAALVTDPRSPLNATDFPKAPPPISVGFKTAVLLDQDDPRGRPFDERVDAARATLSCPRLRRFVASYTDRLTFRRFMSNIGHAVGNTTLKIPTEPDDARRALCR
jgi:arabinofuranosyltransferase